MHIESPTGPTSRRRRRQRKPRLQRVEEVPRRAGARRAAPGATRRPAALPHAPGDRLAHGAVAADRGDLHDDRRGRHDAASRPRARRPGSATCPTRRGRRSRRCSSSRRSTPRSRATATRVYDGRRAPRHRGQPRRGRPDRPGHPRRAGPVASRAWPSASRTSPTRARSNQLTPDEVSGGTFTITNPGALRLDHGHAGDQPAAGRRSSTPRPSSSGRWWSRTSSATTRSRSARMTYLCMGWDHRALDGALRRAVPRRAAQEVGEPGRSTRPARSDGHPPRLHAGAGQAQAPSCATPILRACLAVARPLWAAYLALGDRSARRVSLLPPEGQRRR